MRHIYEAIDYLCNPHVGRMKDPWIKQNGSVGLAQSSVSVFSISRATPQLVFLIYSELVKSSVLRRNSEIFEIHIMEFECFCTVFREVLPSTFSCSISMCGIVARDGETSRGESFKLRFLSVSRYSVLAKKLTRKRLLFQGVVDLTLNWPVKPRPTRLKQSVSKSGWKANHTWLIRNTHSRLPSIHCFRVSHFDVHLCLYCCYFLNFLLLVLISLLSETFMSTWASSCLG